MHSSIRTGTVALLMVCSMCVAAESEHVQLVRTPDGGIQPQAAVDAQGVVHLIYFKGEPKAGNVFYVRQAPGEAEFTKPIQVNGISGSAIAVGTIRGAQLALGRNGRVHVAWNGSKPVPGSTHKGVPMWYARLNGAGNAFDPQRDLMTFTSSLDGGGSVAADKNGNVYVMWHASPGENAPSEAERAVFVARSTDDGKTFAREVRASPRDTGACGCCGMRAFVDAAGNLFALYRAAGEKVNRDETLIVSRDEGRTFEVLNEHRWKAATCPMSSASIAGGKAGTVAAWETADQVYWMKTKPAALDGSRPTAPAGAGKRKHPSVAVAENGEVLMAWTEGTGWQKGGSLAWQLFDANGNPAPQKGRAPGVPAWGLVAAIAKPGGGFIVFY